MRTSFCCGFVIDALAMGLKTTRFPSGENEGVPTFVAVPVSPELGTIDPSAELGKATILLDANPQRLGRPARREHAQPLQANLEGTQGDLAERLTQLVEGRMLDLADEADRQMQLVGLHPADGGETDAQPLDLLPDLVGKVDGDEQAWHGVIPATDPPRPYRSGGSLAKRLTLRYRPRPTLGPNNA